MAEESFQVLATKVLDGEATAAEQAELGAWLAREPSLRDEFDELKRARRVLTEARDVLREFRERVEPREAPATPPPARRVRQFRQALREFKAAHAEPGAQSDSLFMLAWERLRGHPWACATVAVAALFGVIVLFVRPDRPTEMAAPAKSASPAKRAGEIGLLLAQPASRFLAVLSVSEAPGVTRAAQRLPIYSPSSSTRNLQPWVIWKAQPGKTCDVTITDEFDKRTPPWRVTGVVSPLDFAKVDAWKDRPLARGGLYRLRIHETGQGISPTEITEMTFQVLDDATAVRAATPPEKIERARQILTTEPVCFGDALAELLALPPELAETELPLKMKAVVFGKLGFQEEYAAALGKLETLATALKQPPK